MTSAKRFLLWAASFFILVAIYEIALAQSSKEAEGEAAEKAGKLRDALKHYVTAFQITPNGSNDRPRLRSKIIELVRKLDPPPAIPEEAERRMVRGKAAVKVAQNSSDYEAAAKEFLEAMNQAPWWADVYFNLAIVREKQGEYQWAINSFKSYLVAKPNAEDAKAVKEKIYELEFLLEKAQKEAAAKREAEEVRRQAEREAWRRLEGNWIAGSDIANSVQYRLSFNQNEVRIYMTGYCVQGQCTSTDTQSFRGWLRGDRSMTGSVIIESLTVGNRGAYCEFTGGEFPATAQISPNYDEISFSVRGERRYTGLCSRAGTTMPASHNTIRKR